jgi:hypothetical protein
VYAVRGLLLDPLGTGLQEAFRGLLSRLPGLRLAVPTEQVRFKPGKIVRSLRELPVSWDRAGCPR